MKLRDANKLHNGDEVICCESNKSYKVISTWKNYRSGKLSHIFIECVDQDNCLRNFLHTEVK